MSRHLPKSSNRETLEKMGISNLFQRHRPGMSTRSSFKPFHLDLCSRALRYSWRASTLTAKYVWYHNSNGEIACSSLSRLNDEPLRFYATEQCAGHVSPVPRFSIKMFLLHVCNIFHLFPLGFRFFLIFPIISFPTFQSGTDYWLSFKKFNY